MSIGKATAPSAAAMLSTIEVRACMLPCSGESATLKRSAERPDNTSAHFIYTQARCLLRVCVKCTHPRCCSSACTVPECCSIPGCCSRCCLNWARWMTIPVAMERHTQKLLSVILCYDTRYKVLTGMLHCLRIYNDLYTSFYQTVSHNDHFLLAYFFFFFLLAFYNSTHSACFHICIVTVAMFYLTLVLPLSYSLWAG